jgi:hypothetical protein
LIFNQLVAVPSLLIRAAGVLPNDSFKIAIAGQLEESHARFVDMIHLSDPRGGGRHDVEQPALPV